jgi:hypothetical protein
MSDKDDEEIKKLSKEVTEQVIGYRDVFDIISVKLGETFLDTSMNTATDDNGEHIWFPNITRKVIYKLYDNANHNLIMYESLGCKKLDGIARSNWLLEYTYSLTKEAYYWNKYLFYSNHLTDGTTLIEPTMDMLEQSKQERKDLIELIKIK